MKAYEVDFHVHNNTGVLHTVRVLADTKADAVIYTCNAYDVCCFREVRRVKDD
jgi:hypothetical protein